MDGIWLARPDEPARGTPVAVKDLLDTAGLVTTYGSALFADHIPSTSAAAVVRLEQAGYAVAGKTNLHEFAYGISSQNPHYGTVPNPRWCGVVGFKPTFDLVPADGCFPLAPSYDHVGPICATVEGCGELMGVLAPELETVELDSLADIEVGFAWLEQADPLVRERVARALALFPRRRAVDLPLNDPAEYRLFMREVADVHRGLFPERAEDYGENVRVKLGRCQNVTDEQVETARRVRAAYRDRCDEATNGLDLVVTPTIGFVAPPVDIDELDIRERGISLTFPFDSLGWPALVLPCGPAEHGLPASVQLVGPPGDDALVLSAGRLLASLI